MRTDLQRTYNGGTSDLPLSMYDLLPHEHAAGEGRTLGRAHQALGPAEAGDLGASLPRRHGRGKAPLAPRLP